MKHLLKWDKGRANPTEPTARCFLNVVSDYGPFNDTATPADIIACLDENPDVAAEVWRYLTESQGLKDTLTSERDEAHRQLTETWNVIGGPPEHPEEDPEVSTLPAAVRVTLEYEREQLALAREHLKIAEQERDEYKLTTETIKAALFLIDATAEETVAEIRALKKAESRDGAALEKVRKLLGTTVAAEKVPEVLENTLRALSRPCGEDAVQPERASAEEVRDYVSRLTKPEPSGNSCLYIDEDCDPPRPCRRRGWHSGPHTSSLNEARRLDAVVTHEDLKKLKAEIWDELIGACEAPVAVVGYPDLEEQPYLKLGQIMRRERRRRS